MIEYIENVAVSIKQHRNPDVRWMCTVTYTCLIDNTHTQCKIVEVFNTLDYVAEWLGRTAATLTKEASQ